MALGEPTRVLSEGYPETGMRGSAQLWEYDSYGVRLVFVADDAAFDQWRLTPRSELDFERALARDSSETVEEVRAMRDAGAGWGQIAQDLDLQPGLQEEDQVGAGHQATHQGEIGLLVDVVDEDGEGLSPVVITEVVQAGVLSRRANQRLLVERDHAL